MVPDIEKIKETTHELTNVMFLLNGLAQKSVDERGFMTSFLSQLTLIEKNAKDHLSLFEKNRQQMEETVRQEAKAMATQMAKEAVALLQQELPRQVEEEGKKLTQTLVSAENSYAFLSKTMRTQSKRFWAGCLGGSLIGGLFSAVLVYTFVPKITPEMRSKIASSETFNMIMSHLDQKERDRLFSLPFKGARSPKKRDA